MTETVDLRDPNAADLADAFYRRMIDEAAESRAQRTISNRDPRHAAYLIQTFFRAASGHVRIYTSCLARKVGAEDVYASPELIKNAKALLSKEGARVSVIVQDDLDLDDGMRPSDHPFIAALSAPLIGASFWKYAGERKFGDFAVMDESGYRAEMDGEKATAIANFGDPQFASLLVRLFDSMAASEDCRVLIP